MAGWKTLPDLKYAKTDEWLKLEGDTATLGLSDYAQDALNDIVFVELPKVGSTVAAGESFGVVESVKAASDLYMPVAGRVVAVNGDLSGSPETVNQDPYAEGWMVRLKLDDPAQAGALMDPAAYGRIVG